MNKVTKIILLLWFGTVVIITLGAYFGSAKGDLGGTDALVEDMAATAGGYEPITPVVLSEIGENIAFTLAGLFAGIVFGYYWTDLVEGSFYHPGENNDIDLQQRME
ncbi:MAG: hypothetical protein ACE5J5_06835 [Candidatus Hydrothermarchaeales archaeon]